MSDPQEFSGQIEEVIRGLAESINTMAERIKGLQNPLSESQEKVPRATKQLDKIAEQTEAVTHHMLDTIEQLTQREQDIRNGLRQIKTMAADGNCEKVQTMADALIEKTDRSSNDAFSIMNALQFQDITCQQMNHAAAMLEDIETKLLQIISVMHGEVEADAIDWNPGAGKDRVFDPHADMVGRKTPQEDIDSLFEGKEA
ncbi:MAG: protein phosphatase CheZ [candidate division Zixibacteria bacterium]|nr:protein phosphatase CheZ [candidate division Zixibacteria bacterium]